MAWLLPLPVIEAYFPAFENVLVSQLYVPQNAMQNYEKTREI
jgi:hypothetical protein